MKLKSWSTSSHQMCWFGLEQASAEITLMTVTYQLDLIQESLNKNLYWYTCM